MCQTLMSSVNCLSLTSSSSLAFSLESCLGYLLCCPVESYRLGYHIYSTILLALLRQTNSSSLLLPLPSRYNPPNFIHQSPMLYHHFPSNSISVLKSIHFSVRFLCVLSPPGSDHNVPYRRSKGDATYQYLSFGTSVYFCSVAAAGIALFCLGIFSFVFFSC